MPYEWSTLTAELKDKASPLRKLLDAEFPNTRELVRQYKSSNPPLLVDNTGLPTGQLSTLGTAFDLWVRSVLDPVHPDHLALDFVSYSPLLSHQAPAVNQLSSILNGGDSDIDRVSAAWALSWFVEGYRAGPQVLLNGPLAPALAGHTLAASDVMGMVPPSGIRQIRELDLVAQEFLYPHVVGTRLHLGPTFSGSELCPADADLIAQGTLIDIKVRLGLQDKRTGARRDNLTNIDLYQLLGYTLWDFDDEFAIDAVALYSARFGHLHRWSLDEFLETLAGHPIDLADMRSQTRMMLES